MLPVSDISISTVHILCDAVKTSHISFDFLKWIRHLTAQRPNIKECRPITFVFHGINRDTQFIVETLFSFLQHHIIKLEESEILSHDFINKHHITYVIDEANLEKDVRIKLYDSIEVKSTIQSNNYSYYEVKRRVESYLNREVPITFSFANNDQAYVDFDFDKYQQSIREVVVEAAKSIAFAEDSFAYKIIQAPLEKYTQACNKGQFDLYPNCGLQHFSMTVDLDRNVYVCHNIHKRLAPSTISHINLVKATEQIINSSFSNKPDCSLCEYLPMCNGGCPFFANQTRCKVMKIFFEEILKIGELIKSHRTEIEL